MTKNKRKGVLEGIKDIASNIHNKITKKKAPEIEAPLRSLSNVKYDAKQG